MAPLAEVLAAANRYTPRKVAIDDPALGTLNVTGTFHADRPDELAAALAAAIGLEVVPRGDDLLLRGPRRWCLALPGYLPGFGLWSSVQPGPILRCRKSIVRAI